MTAAAFLAIWLVHLMAAVSPGPAVLMAARVGLAEGARRGAWLATGLGLGAVIWAAAALLGLAVVFRAAPGLLWAIKIAGAVYLLWLAVKMWRQADDPPERGAPAARLGSGAAALRLGVTTQLANPKPAVFFGAVFVSLVPADASNAALALLLAAVWANEALWNALVARLFATERVRRGYAGLKPAMDRAFGAALAALGVKIAAT